MVDNLGLEPVSIVVVNYNAGPMLAECIGSCIKQAGEIFVVDNASTDNSLVSLHYQFKDDEKLNIVRNEKNLGFAAACNIGIESANGHYLLFLNPDCILEPGAVSRLVDVLKNQSGAGMVGGLLLNPNGTEQGGGRRAVPTPWRSFVRAFGLNRLSQRWPKLFYDFYKDKQPLPDKPIEVEAISGACMLVSRDAIEDVGKMDDGYFLHCEDLDWCMRFRQRSWKILFVPDVRIIHHQGTCSKSKPIFVAWQKHKGMIRFYRKFFRHQYPGLLMWAVIIGVWIRFAGTAIFYLVKNLWHKVGNKA